MQLFVATAHEVPIRPCRSTGEACSASGSHRPGDALLDSVLSKADPTAQESVQSVEAILLEARAAEAQGRLALAARLFSRAFWRCRHELQGDSAALAIFFDMVQCRLLLGDGGETAGFAVDTYCQVRAQRLARQLRSGMVEMNGQSRGAGAPFGGMKQSGNGREGGVWGLEDFLEVKSVSGWAG